MNWILTLTRNNLHLTKKAIDTFRKQDIGDVKILVIDNGSKDNTPQWLASQHDLNVIQHTSNIGVAAAWNEGLDWLFRKGWSDGSTPKKPMAEYCLVVNNDVELRPDTYKHLLLDGGGFVTAVGTQDPDKIMTCDPPNGSTRPHPDFSCFLIRSWVFNKVGPFDEEFHGAYAEDGDMDLRMWMAGIRGYCIDLPYLHLGAQTIKAAPPQEARRISEQAGRNREYFKRKWGFEMGSEEYYQKLDKGSPSPSSMLQQDGQL